MTGVLIRKERFEDTQTHQSEGGHEMTKAETEVMQLQAKESWTAGHRQVLDKIRTFKERMLLPTP